MGKVWKNKVNMQEVIYSLMVLFFCIFFGGSIDARYIMTYLYGTGDYLAMIDDTGVSMNEVSPSYFDITNNGVLKINYIDAILVNNLHSRGIKVVPFLSNHWDRYAGRDAISSAVGRETLVNGIVDAIIKHNLDGINVDIENLTEADRKNYTEFVKLLRIKMPPDKSVVTSVATNPNGYDSGWQGSYDYKALGEFSDYIMIMAYDEHYEGGSSGPVASNEFTEKSIQYALSLIPKEKLVLGIPFYGRYWSEDGKILGKAVSLKKMREILSKYENIVTYDNVAKSPKAEVKIKSTDGNVTISGTKLNPGKYIFWYEDANSIEAKMKLVEKYDIKGIGSWKLGLEDKLTWETIENNLLKNTDVDGCFKDVSSKHWAYNQISNMKNKGLIIGKTKELFGPEDYMTRAELATIACRILDLEEIDIRKNEGEMKYIAKTFKDVENHWAKNDIMRLTQIEILNGYEDKSFRPDTNISRAEVMKIIKSLLGTNEADSSCDYSDLDKSHWAYESISSLSSLEIINGYSDGSFKPEAYITRAEMAEVLSKLCEKYS